ncbi:MAG TPA: J domain-containing protein [Candidatus Microsaccharimonas sp.]|nr:J domain-containing protein [Candidatus Microsaccharimonas sp.]
MSEGFVDYYQLLGVPTDAEGQQIRVAFLRLAKEHHPDVGGSTEDMQTFTRAYRTLISEASRRKYDLQHEFYAAKPGKYGHSQADTGAGEIDDLSDDEIDEFLDTLYREARDSAAFAKPTVKQRIKKLFEI